MPYTHMTLEELSRHIGMDAREVRRLADRGSLPGQRVGGVWRFNRAALLDWLQREIHNLEPQHIRNLERAMADRHDAELLAELLPSACIELNLPARSKPSALRELLTLAERSQWVYDRDTLLDALEQREALCSTALPGGVAIPHPRTPLPYATAEPLVAVAYVPAGVPFGAPDGRVTDVFVLIISHEERRHLHTLARVALLLQAGLAQRVREAADAAAALQAVIDLEREMLSGRG